MATRKGSHVQDDLVGTPQPDFLLGQGGDDKLSGGAGNDVIDGGAGDDTLQGGAGNDRLLGGDGEDRINGGGGDDRMNGGTGGDVEQGGSGNDVVNGGAGDDVTQGGAGDDVMNGGGGQDFLLGGAGDDKLFWDPNDFSVDGGVGFDTLSVGGAAVNLVGVTTLHGIEAIDMRARGANTLVADAASIINATETPHLLRVFGDSEDALELTGAWTRGRSAVSGFTRYTSGLAKVDVADAVAVTFGNHLSLGNLNGFNGVHIAGANVTPSSSGDINGDGFDDLLLGSPTNSHSSIMGSAYLIFGRGAGLAAEIDTDHLKSRQGMALHGTKSEHYTGVSVAIVGDLNHDGFDDFAVMTGNYSPVDLNSVRNYIVFGHGGAFPADFAMDKVNGDNGYILDGIPIEPMMGGPVSLSTAGDFNGDGFDDFAVGVPTASNGVNVDAGATFVVFGSSAPYDKSVDLSVMPPTEMWRINGAQNEGTLGTRLASGDFNGDGFDDLIMGSSWPNMPVYVVFGKSSGFDVPLSVASLNGTNGFTVASSSTVTNLAVADLNGDGYDDAIMQNQANFGATVRVVFGHGGAFASSVSSDVLTGSNGFNIVGPVGEHIGAALASAGDVNGDGYEDLLIGVPDATANRQLHAGATYLVFGHGGGFDAQFNLATMTIEQGLRIDGFAKNQFSGGSVSSAGDLNGDGYGDIAIAGLGMEGTPNGIPPSGTYVIYGRDFAHHVVSGGAGNDVLTGTDGADSLVGGRGNDVLDGGAGSDSLIGGAGHDILVWDAADHRVDGGNGIDTLRIDGADQTLDLTLLPSKVITGINVVDLTGSGDNHLRLSLPDLLQLTDHAALRVAGNAGDSVVLTTSGWTPLADRTVSGENYHAYFNGSATLLVDTDISLTIS